MGEVADPGVPPMQKHRSCLPERLPPHRARSTRAGAHRSLHRANAPSQELTGSAGSSIAPGLGVICAIARRPEALASRATTTADVREGRRRVGMR